MEALWIALAFGLGLAVRRLGLPPLVGYLAAGFVINALGYGHAGSEALEHVAHIGVLLLLFTVGLKLRIKNVIQPEVWAGTLLHLALTALLLGAVFHLLVGLGWAMAAVLGTALGLSSTVVAVKVLEEKRELKAFHGRVAVGILIVQDLVAVALLSFSGGDPPSPWALLVLALPLARPLVRRLMDWTGHDEL
ncbi:MAG: cation:proton antiporter, partial [Pseudomonadota bacterium]|nr:cation:proton antiporter [Pseudomonadota bacterium]